MSEAAHKKRIAVLVSGGGSNLQALIAATQTGHLDAEIVVVGSNKPGAYGLVRAEKAGIPTAVLSTKQYRTGMGEAYEWRARYGQALADKLLPYQPDLVVLAGFMHVCHRFFLEAFPNRVINLHPALPGHFPGAHAIDEAWEAFGRGEITETGCMIHYATPELDAGPVLVSAVVPLLPTDSRQDFETRLHTIEHRAIVLGAHIALLNAC